MYELARCSRCQEVVRLPNSQTTWVRCPHCQSEYPLEPFLDRLTPALEAIPAPAPMGQTEIELGDDTSSHAELLNGIATANDYANSESRASESNALEPRASQSDGSESDGSQPPVVLDEVKAEVRSPETLRAERRKKLAARRKQPASPAIGFAKVALGGVAGLAIGQIILWWLPHPYRTDPLKLGPRLPAVLRFLAPDSIRLTSESPTSLPSVSDPPSHDRQTDTSGAKHSETPAALPTPKSSAVLSSHEAVIGKSDTWQFSLAELKETLNAAREIDRRFPQSVSETTPSATGQQLQAGDREWYSAVSKLGPYTAFADSTDLTVQAFLRATDAFLEKVVSSERKRTTANRLALEFWPSSSHQRDGILLCGSVVEVRQSTHFIVTRLKVASESGKVVEVVQRPHENRQLSYTVGDEVAMLGVALAQPTVYLEGYEGVSDGVVLSGLVVKLANAR